MNEINSIHYHSDVQWISMAEMYGLEFCKVKTYDKNNPQGLYFASFKKI